MIRGHRSCQTVRSYFRPTSKNTMLEPATARMVCSRSARSALHTFDPGNGFGLRLTKRYGVWLAARSLPSSLLIGPPAPRIVVTFNSGFGDHCLNHPNGDTVTHGRGPRSAPLIRRPAP